MFKHRKPSQWNSYSLNPSKWESSCSLLKRKEISGEKIVVRVSDWTGNDSLDNKSCFGSRMMKRKMGTRPPIALLIRFLHIMRTSLKEHQIIMRYPFLIMRRNTKKLTRFTLTKFRRKSINELTIVAFNFLQKLISVPKEQI